MEITADVLGLFGFIAAIFGLTVDWWINHKTTGLCKEADVVIGGSSESYWFDHPDVQIMGVVNIKRRRGNWISKWK
ncbi:MAG: hypothetical protein OXH98_10465 [Caldilineaceae bacterium]|nr:hypothetical protein [Caldilineaceae bacterium]